MSIPLLKTAKNRMISPMNDMVRVLAADNIVKSAIDVKKLYEHLVELKKTIENEILSSVQLKKDIIKELKSNQDKVYRVLESEIERLSGITNHILSIQKGEPGKDADHEAIVKDVLAKIIPPKDGKNADENAIVKAVLRLLPGFIADAMSKMPKHKDMDEETMLGMFNKLAQKKKIKLEHIDGLQQTLDIIRNHKALGYAGGGQGKIVRPTLTTTDNLTYTFSVPLLSSEMAVYRGGGRIFSEDSDFTTTAVTGDPGRVKSITLTVALATNETLRIEGRT